MLNGLAVDDLEARLLERVDVRRADQVVAVDRAVAQRLRRELRVVDRDEDDLVDAGLLAPVVVVAERA